MIIFTWNGFPRALLIMQYPQAEAPELLGQLGGVCHQWPNSQKQVLYTNTQCKDQIEEDTALNIDLAIGGMSYSHNVFWFLKSYVKNSCSIIELHLRNYNENCQLSKFPS